jgi:tetratricopeptide (TPR) repeat protein
MRKRITIILLPLVSIIFCVGCESYESKKQAAYDRWEKTSAKAKISVATELFEDGRVEQAKDTAEECLQTAPELAEAHLLLGRICSVQGRSVESKESLQNALKLDESLDKAWFCLASIAQQENQLEIARQSYEKALLLKPDNADYVIALAEIDIAQGRYQNALELLTNKTRLFPDNVTLRIATADILGRMGKTKEAIKIYNQALLLEPNNKSVNEAIAYCYITDQQWEKAVKTFEKLIGNTVDSGKKATYLNILAMCSMNAGQYGRAVKYYDQLSVEQRENPQIWLQMGQAALGIEAPKRALACAARALDLQPGWPDAIALKGCAQYLDDDYDSAIKTFGKITSDKNMAGFAWLMTGRCYKQLGQTDLADKAFQNAAELGHDSKLITLLMKQKT